MVQSTATSYGSVPFGCDSFEAFFGSCNSYCAAQGLSMGKSGTYTPPVQIWMEVMDVSLKTIGFLRDTSDWRDISWRDMLVQVDWSASQPRNPLHTAVRSNHLDSAPFRVVVGLARILSSDGDRCIMLWTAPELRALGGTTWTASLSLLLGSLHAASVVHLRRWELRRAGLQLTQKEESRIGKHHVQCIPGYTYGSFLSASTFGSLGLWKIHVSQRQPPGLWGSRHRKRQLPGLTVSKGWGTRKMAQEVDSCGWILWTFFWVEIGISAKLLRIEIYMIQMIWISWTISIACHIKKFSSHKSVAAGFCCSALIWPCIQVLAVWWKRMDWCHQLSGLDVHVCWLLGVSCFFWVARKGGSHSQQDVW